MKRSKMNVIVSMVVLLMFLAACSAGVDRGAALDTTLEVELTDSSFLPEKLTVTAGEEITLQLRNNGTGEHSFVLLSEPATAPFDDDDADHTLAQLILDAGESGTLTFTAPAAAGEYPIVCAEPGHLETGMDAKLIVVQPQP